MACGWPAHRPLVHYLQELASPERGGVSGIREASRCPSIIRCREQKHYDYTAEGLLRGKLRML